MQYGNDAIDGLKKKKKKAIIQSKCHMQFSTLYRLLRQK